MVFAGFHHLTTDKLNNYIPVFFVMWLIETGRKFVANVYIKIDNNPWDV